MLHAIEQIHFVSLLVVCCFVPLASTYLDYQTHLSLQLRKNVYALMHTRMDN